VGGDALGPAISAVVSHSLCSELFNTLSLDHEGHYAATRACKDAWSVALHSMLNDTDLHNKLVLAQGLFEEQWQLDLHPWVILKSLDGLLCETTKPSTGLFSCLSAPRCCGMLVAHS